MRITSSLWMRVLWFVLLVTAFFVPLYVLGIELNRGDNCAPEVDWADYQAIRELARWTWLASFVVVGSMMVALLRFAPTFLGTMPVVAAFVLWKGLGLLLAFIASPSCFEVNGNFADRYRHPLEDLAGIGTIFAWVVMLLIIFIAMLVGPDKHADQALD